MSEENLAELRWRKSTRSGGDNCVLVAFTRERVYMRDSKDPGGPILSFEVFAWKAFLEDVGRE